MGSSLSWARDQEEESSWRAAKAHKEGVVQALSEMNHESLDSKVDSALQNLNTVIGSGTLRNSEFDRLKETREIIKTLFQRN